MSVGVIQQPGAQPPPTSRRSISHGNRLVRFALAVTRVPAFSVIVATGALILVIGGFHPRFFQPSQLADILQSSVYVAFLAMGLSYLIAMRDIDLSVGSAFALCMTFAAVRMRDGWDPWLAVVLALVLGLVLGLVNSAIVAFVRIPTIITTLATLSAFSGLATMLASGQNVTGFSYTTSFFNIVGGTVGGFPTAFIILIGVAIPMAATLHLTPFGNRVLAIGSNPQAARFSGISIRRVRTQVLVLIGLMAAISGLIGLAFFTSANPTIGSSFPLEAIAAAVIGGTPLRGGTASILGAIVGAILLSVVTAGLSYFGIDPNATDFATGVVIVVAVGFDSVIRYRRGPADADY